MVLVIFFCLQGLTNWFFLVCKLIAADFFKESELVVVEVAVVGDCRHLLLCKANKCEQILVEEMLPDLVEAGLDRVLMEDAVPSFKFFQDQLMSLSLPYFSYLL